MKSPRSGSRIPLSTVDLNTLTFPKTIQKSQGVSHISSTSYSYSASVPHSPPSPADTSVKRKRSVGASRTENDENQAPIGTPGTPKKPRVDKKPEEANKKSVKSKAVIKTKHRGLEERMNSEETQALELKKALEAEKLKTAERERELKATIVKNAELQRQIDEQQAKLAEFERQMIEQRAKFAELYEQAKSQEKAQARIKEALESEKLKTDAKLQATEEENTRLRSALVKYEDIVAEYEETILDYDEQRIGLQEKLTETEDKLKQAEYHRIQVSTYKIRNVLEKALSAKLSKKAMVEIILTDGQIKLVTIGRPPVIGESKYQLAHIIPYGLIEKLAKNVIKSEYTFDAKMTLLIDSVLTFFKYDKGICIKESDVESLGLKLRTIVAKASISYETATNIFYLIEGNCEGLIQDPLKRQQAEALFTSKKQKYIEKQLTALKDAIHDDNTKQIFCKELTGLIFSLFNKKTLAAYPSEGNISESEIRLYDTLEAAQVRGSKAFKIVSTFDLKNLIDKKVDLNGKIRVVANSGSKVKEALKGLSIIDSIFEIIFKHRDPKSKIDEYNNKYNVQIKLSNSNPDLNSYNSDLNQTDFKTQVHYHIAKQAFGMFGLKALEEKVLAPTKDKKAILGYATAGGEKHSYYKLKDGVTHRTAQKREAEVKYPSLTKFRPEETNFEFLARKSIELVDFLKLAYSSFLNGFVSTVIDQESCPTMILKAFTNLIALDYQIDHSSFYTNYVLPLTRYWDIEHDSDLSSEIELSGEEFTNLHTDQNF